MSLDSQTLEGIAIRQLHPINNLSDSGFEQFSAIVTVIEVPNGYNLFEIDDKENDFIFLLAGEVILRSDNMMVEKITANTDASNFPLAHQVPRKIGAIVSSPTARFIRFSVDFFNELELAPVVVKSVVAKTTEKTEQNNMGDDIDNQDDDWMETLLLSPLFQLLPSANLQKILISLEEKTFKKGEIVIKQGDVGDYYYLIRKGKCLISRKPSPSAKEIRLARLQVKDTFGEDALISGEPRSVTVSAITNLIVQRLEREHFLKLIKTPLIHALSYKDLIKEKESGTFLLDVRPEKEFKANHMEGAVNIPAFSLRMQLKSLNRDNKIIVICHDGKGSEVSCFFLLKNGFDAVILKEGMKKVPNNISQEAATYDIGDDLGLEPKPIMTLERSQKPPDKKPTHAANTLKTENSRLKKSNQELAQKNAHLNEQLAALKQHVNQLDDIVTTIKGVLL